MKSPLKVLVVSSALLVIAACVAVALCGTTPTSKGPIGLAVAALQSNRMFYSDRYVVKERRDNDKWAYVFQFELPHETPNNGLVLPTFLRRFRKPASDITAVVYVFDNDKTECIPVP